MAKSEIQVIEYIDEAEKNPFADWLAKLTDKAHAKVVSAIYLMKAGNFGDVKPVGGGVSERRIHWGPGLRIYFARDGSKLILLLGGGTKSRQTKDINNAKAAWAEYKSRKKNDESN
ncbi:type II toxin-antitoxin system RelE/ParE family toxin [Bythopirellula goksoeyrii]|uniref:Addiction module killer protein n=1 Tax=Bythopirellula goksoeyrii TaxID=1400387 RepID=A0A5B9QCW9_9BACT|nr:type II toxin-antitoxin system RelE/ParE family toxin [Bythopirellula goksoeyrii]QEG36808.1 hypothetical protein Pr1d_41440 [Bythopirellula goksoeyrii]